MPFQNVKTYHFHSSDLPKVAGVYGILNAKRQFIYIGQTDNLNRRMGEHRNDTSHCMHGYAPVYVVFEVVTSQAQRDARERALIAEFKPPCNKTL